MLPLAEYLIARGDVADPSPLLRPFRRADLVAAIDAARLDPASASGRMAARLRAELADPELAEWAAIRARVGIEAGTRARRDLLHPAGDDGTDSTAGGARGRFRNLLLVSRPVASDRLRRIRTGPAARSSSARTRRTALPMPTSRLSSTGST
ncbi:MAG: hypothetical protein R2882_12665 [Gemmatimonadales bacterium]